MNAADDPSQFRRDIRLLVRVLLLIMPASILFGMLLDDDGFGVDTIVASVGSAVIIGAPIFAFELFFVSAPAGAAYRRWPLLPFILGRLSIWGAWIFVGSLIANETVWLTTSETPLREPDFWWTVGFSFLVSTSAAFLLTVSQLLGPGVLADMMMGRYHRPRTEDRAVAFVDLKGSTALAERIGTEAFFDAMTDFADLVAAAVRRSDGQIYDYVGDEVIVVWRETTDLTRCVEALADLYRTVQAGGRGWDDRFGALPAFRAAFHVGPVVIGEIGGDKRAIVLLGDTMNVGARLEQAARDMGEEMLVSDRAADRIGSGAGFRLEALPPVILRGKADPVQIHRLVAVGP